MKYKKYERWTGDNRRAQEDEKKTAETEVGRLQY